MSVYDKRNDLPLSELDHLMNEDETLEVRPVLGDDRLVRALIKRDHDRVILAWGIGATEFDAAMRAILTLCPDHIVDYPEYEEDYNHE